MTSFDISSLYNFGTMTTKSIAIQGYTNTIFGAEMSNTMGVIHNLNDKTRLNRLFFAVVGVEPDVFAATVTMQLDPVDPVLTAITPTVTTVTYVNYFAGEDFQLF